MKKYSILLAVLIFLGALLSYSPHVSAATITTGSTYSSTDGTSGDLVINSVSSVISGSNWNVTIKGTVAMNNSYLYTGGAAYYRYFSATIAGVTGPSLMIKSNTEYWNKGTTHSFTYTMSVPVNPNNNKPAARFYVKDGSGNLNDVATFDTGTGNTVTLTAVQKATSLTLNISSITLYTSETAQIVPTVLPSNTYNKAVTYSSSNATIASVSSSGLFTANKAGSAVITVTTADGSNISETISITVTQYVTGLSANASSATLYVGQTHTIIPTLTPSDATDQSLSYVSSNGAVASVSSSGVVTAKKAGSAVVTVTATDQGTISTTVTITVKQRATSLAITNPVESIYTGESYQLSCEILPIDTTDQSLTFSSGSSDVAEVSEDGVITGVKAGIAVITVKTNDGSNLTDTFTLSVKQYVTSIDITPVSPILYTGETVNLSIGILPVDTTEKSFAITSDDPSVASVTPEGIVTANKAGTAVITVRASDASGVSVSVSITVKQLAEDVIISNPPDVLYLGSSYQLDCEALPVDTTDPSLSFVSNDPLVLTIDDAGLITPNSKGMATVTVSTNDGSNISKSITITVKQYVNEIISEQSEFLLYTGETATLNTTVLPDDADDKTVSFASSDESIATINATGKITAVKAGVAMITITATDGSGISTQVRITVRQHAEVITVDEEEVTLNVTATYQLNPIVLPDDTTDKTLSFVSSDESIVTVSESGLVTAHSAGSASVTITATDQNLISKVVTFTVKQPVTDLIITSDLPTELYTGCTYHLLCTVIPSNATQQTLSYSSNDAEIAQVDEDGLITTLTPGEVTITVDTTDKSGITKDITFTVRQSVTAIDLETEKVTLYEGDTVKLIPTVSPDDAYNKTLSYVSSDPYVATIDDDVIITALKEGTAIIMVTAADPAGVSATVKVIVRSPEPTITLLPILPTYPITKIHEPTQNPLIDVETTTDENSNEISDREPNVKVNAVSDHDNLITKWIGIIIGVIGILVITLVLFILIPLVRRKKKEEEDDECTTHKAK